MAQAVKETTGTINLQKISFKEQPNRYTLANLVISNDNTRYNVEKSMKVPIIVNKIWKISISISLLSKSRNVTPSHPYGIILLYKKEDTKKEDKNERQKLIPNPNKQKK